MKKLLLMLLILVCADTVYAQINAKLMRYMDVSDTHITFVYGGDIWIVPVEGGTAMQVTHSPGEESWPRFSPDGNHIAYTASYNGNADVFVMPTTGGVPTRVTYHSHNDRMIDWHPNGKELMVASRRDLGQRSSRQFFMVSKDGGLAERVNIPYGELATFSPDGKKLAYITKITENYPFKRYRGGLASDVILHDMSTGTFTNITDNHANDGKPAWSGDNIYFLSDQGENIRLNIYKYDTSSGETSKITNFENFDISYLSAGAGKLVFEMGGSLYLMDTATEEYKVVDVNVVSDLSVEMPRTVNVGNRIASMTASPDAKRIVFEARGELFNVPVKEGYSMNMTQNSGAFDRHPSWSPDGKHIAYWSDADGEYNIYLADGNGSGKVRKLTNRKKGFGYALNWSPNSKHIAFIDETNTIRIVNADNGKTTDVTHTNWNIGHGGRFGYAINWSPDSKWLTFNKGLENAQFAIMLYDVEGKQVHQVTSGFYNDANPVFSTDGKYLFYATGRNFSSVYSDLDATWVYPNSTQLAAVSLTEDVPSPMHTKSDEFEVKEEKKEDKKKDKKDEKKEEDNSVKIDLNGFESRITILPPSAGNLSNLMAFDGMLVYRRFANSGSGGGPPSLMAYDVKKRKEVKIMDAVFGVAKTADGKSLLVSSRGKYGVIKPAPGQKISDPIPTGGLEMELIPKEEWKQIFNDTWRRHRDFFYDPNMHQLDWNALRDQYGALLDDARTRWDVSNIQSNLAAELSAGHTYTRGGDTESVRFVGTGYLGIDWELSNNMYRIKRIVQPAEWNTQVRSPFDRPGVDVNVGDYIHSVNGITLDPNKDPYAAFEGLDSDVVALMVSSTGKASDAKKVVVETLSQGQEGRLRYLEWIENNRKMVDELSNGQLGYIYMSNTGGQGQLELVSMYYGQLHKKGFIVDERFNGGGQLADRFLELMQRPVVYNLHWRHGRDHTHPTSTNTGPMGMLINGWAGSGGDGLPWAFQELEAGPIVGERTLGILVGPATGHTLIDGGGITVPGARLYDNDGHWFWEGEGVAPDFPVWDDPNMLVNGRDPQMEKVVEEVLKMLKGDEPRMTKAPPYEDRTAKGFRNKN